MLAVDPTNRASAADLLKDPVLSSIDNIALSTEENSPLGATLHINRDQSLVLINYEDHLDYGRGGGFKRTGV